MTEALVDWVLTQSPYGGGMFVVHVVVAHHADSRRYLQRPQSKLATDSRMSIGNLRRTVRTIIDDGLIEVAVEAVGRTPARLRIVTSARAVERATARALERLNRVDRAPLRAQTEQLAMPESATPPLLEKLLDVDQYTAEPAARRAPREHEQAARSIVERVWLARAVPPAQPFVAIVKIVEALLAVGWPAAEVEQAAVAVPTISSRWCEAWLNERRGRGSVARAMIDDDRLTPGGKIEL